MAKDDKKYLAESRAKRLIILRELSGLSRHALYQRYDLAPGTLQNWESARSGGLSEKGARKLISIYRAEGVYCDEQWLLHGIGTEPDYTRNNLNHNVKITNNIAKEILYFKKHNTYATELVVQDDAMLPWYKPGDVVMGIRVFKHDITKLIGSVCIIQTKEHGKLVRLLKPGEHEEVYTLQALNVTSNHSRACITNVALHSVASITWIRSSHFSVQID